MSAKKDYGSGCHFGTRVVRSQWNRAGFKDPDPVFVDEKTGEVIPGYGPEKVDSSGYEPIEKMVQRFFKGELSPAVSAVDYEFGPDIDPVMALEMINPILRRGVDRVDAVKFIASSREFIAEMMRKKSGQRVDEKGAPAVSAGTQPPLAESTGAAPNAATGA